MPHPSSPVASGPGACDRRTFLTASTLAAAGAIAGCASPHGAKPGSVPDILDTHTHFYDPTRPQGVPWPPKDDAFLYRTVLPEEWKRLAVPLGVRSTVVVEASPWVADNDWILDLADREPALVGLVGHLEPGHPTFAHDLERLARRPRFRGVRIGVWGQSTNRDEAARLRDLERLAESCPSLDVLTGPDRLPEVAELARRLPALRVVVDHCANVKIDGKEPPLDWLRGLESAAAVPNVVMKVSGLVEGTGRVDGTAPADAAFYGPVLDAIWNAFGASRVVFGSNWPVSARYASYATVLGIVRDYFEAKGPKAARLYFRENARTAYRLDSLRPRP